MGFIKWKASDVADAVDEIEAVLKDAAPILQKAKDLAAKAARLPNLPQYMEQRIRTLEHSVWQADWLPGREINSVRAAIPEDALAREKTNKERLGLGLE